MSERAAPFHCPYCGETDLWPHDGTSGTEGASGRSSRDLGWECRACLRAFTVRMLGQIRPSGGQR